MLSRPDGLVASNLSVGYGKRDVIAFVDLAVPAAAFTVLVGPNGSGKSTLLRALAGLGKPSSGAVSLDGRPLADFTRKALARKIGFLPQSPQTPEGLSVEELVRQGRYPHQGLFSRWTAADEKASEEALSLTGMTELRGRPLGTLSGGQRQRAWIATSLAQQTDILLLDEPTTFLDIAHQLEVLTLLRDLAQRQGKTVVVVLHDLNQAIRFADYIVMIAGGDIKAAGSPADVVTSDSIRAVFGIAARMMIDPIDKTQVIIPMFPSI